MDPLKLDTYTRRARLAPALLTLLPLALAGMAAYPEGILGWGALWGVVTYCGGGYLLAHAARKMGKRKERELFEAWRGKPTTRMLRHREAKSTLRLKRLHGKLEEIAGLSIPTAEEEQYDPERADEIYEECTRALRELTRNTDKFGLLHAENCGYGFRRNLWGMKPVGIATAFMSALAVVALIAYRLVEYEGVSPIAYVSGATNVLFLVAWIRWITPHWVQRTAEAYANQLFAASEVL